MSRPLSQVLQFATHLLAASDRAEFLRADREIRRNEGWGIHDVNDLHRDAKAVVDFVEFMRANR